MTRITLKIRGEDLKRKLKIRDGEDGRTPIAGIDFPLPKDGIGVDGKDAKPEDVLALVEDRLPQLGEKVRDSLELLEEDARLKIGAIKDLREELEELKKQAKKVVYGGGAISASHSPLHESFSMNGVLTSVTLSQGVAAQGNAIIVRYQGQTQDMTTHYTVDGNTINFTFTPADGTTISVTYWP